MPRAWRHKDERQYQHIRKSLLREGKRTADAQEIAARTVNKQRREEGCTPNADTQGTGHPHQPLEERSRRALYNRAKELNIAGRSSMNKPELITAIRKRQ